jgi:hypothetical protein
MDRLAILALLLVAFLARGWPFRGQYGNPDEYITINVVGHMRHTGTWDTNWKNAPLPEWFKRDQYNFSAYLLAARIWQPLADVFLPGDFRTEHGGLHTHRLMSAVLSSLVLIPLYHIGLQLSGRLCAYAAAILYCLNPLMVQDAHYARPEAFATLLTSLLALLCLPRDGRTSLARVGMASFLSGLLIATKVSFVPLALLPAWAAVRYPAGGQEMLVGGFGKAWKGPLVCGVSLLLGAFLGTPYAFFHPGIFWSGATFLSRHYSGQHPPHGRLGGGMVVTLVLEYFQSTQGTASLLLFVIAAVLSLVRKKEIEVVVLVVPVVFYVGLFSTRSVFFERNFSHVVPLFLCGMALGLTQFTDWLRGLASGPRLAIPTFLAILALCLFTPARLLVTFLGDDLSGDAELRKWTHQNEITKNNWGIRVISGLLLCDKPHLQGISGLIDEVGTPVILGISEFNDEFTPHYVASLAKVYDIEEVGRFVSPYTALPVCTFLTYHSCNRLYILVKGKRPAVHEEN